VLGYLKSSSDYELVGCRRYGLDEDVDFETIMMICRRLMGLGAERRISPTTSRACLLLSYHLALRFTQLFDLSYLIFLGVL